METFDPQATFDRVRGHLLSQGRQSRGGISPSMSSMYRGASGLKCAIGCLIPDEAYDPQIEGLAVAAEPWPVAESALVAVLDRSLAPGWREPRNLELLKRLQRIHDWLEPAGWPPALYALALDLGLKP